MYAIEFKNVSKKYTFSNSHPLLMKSFIPSRKHHEKLALNNISFKIKKGETVGIIGENGSGKSTILKIIAGITTPTKGDVTVSGKIASLIELGAGFHPDLTGYENIYLNGTLLGLTKKEIDKKYKEITDFADIGEYINQPVKTYSSGMAIRLGFSVAIHTDPDILLIDEVLAVGDEEFQRKCITTINEFKKQNKTIVIVTHNLQLVSNLSDKIILVSKGRIKKKEEKNSIIGSYLNSSHTKQSAIDANKLSVRWGVGDIRFKKIFLLDKNGKTRFAFNNGELAVLKLSIETIQIVKNPIFGFYLYDSLNNIIFTTNTSLMNINLGIFKKKSTKLIDVKYKIPLLSGLYYFTIALASNDKLIFYDWIERAIFFKVKNNLMSQSIADLKPVIEIIQ